MNIKLTTQWSSAHFYNQPSWTKEKNLQVFGKCHSEFGHGHDYKLEVEFSEADSGDQESLAEILTALHEKLDHHHLNFVIPEFKTKIPTTENLALFCYEFITQKVKAENLNCKTAHARLYEKPDLWSEIWA